MPLEKVEVSLWRKVDLTEAQIFIFGPVYLYFQVSDCLELPIYVWTQLIFMRQISKQIINQDHKCYPTLKYLLNLGSNLAY